METQISHCPLCGVEFQELPDNPDSRSSTGLRCENCNEVLEITINRFPLAQAH